ncbi:MAG: 2-polyprenylphenol 6-hydroxylase [Rickettsiaceae bacterium]|nr:MAG: 2-polyprenylphenol 6-hydroxylase [Rickettsiaceae bacterium]
MIFINILRMLHIVSKQRLLTYHDYSQSFKVKAFGILLELLCCPLVLFQRPLDSFSTRISSCFESLGPVYVKFGQTLSTRPDLVGVNVATKLQYLQNSLFDFDSAIAKKIVEHELNQTINQIFIYFNDKAVASASIAQVHKAQLLNGDIVAVKILRPGIGKKYQDDINLLYFVAKIWSKINQEYNRLKLLEVVNVLKNTMHQELDLRNEAASISEITDYCRNNPNLCIPKIYWQFNSSNLLITQWVEGISIYDNEGLLSANIDKTKLSKDIAEMFLSQAYEYGFFHADLHPGNILIKDDGRIALIDFGIMGRLADSDRLAIAEILAAFLNRDYLRVAQIHIKVGYVPKNTDLYSFASACRTIYEPMVNLASKDISISKLLIRLFEITEKFGMETQPQLLLLQKTMIVVEGIGQSLNSNLNMWELAKPWITKWAVKNLSPEAKVLAIFKKAIIKFMDDCL